MVYLCNHFILWYFVVKPLSLTLAWEGSKRCSRGSLFCMDHGRFNPLSTMVQRVVPSGSRVTPSCLRIPSLCLRVAMFCLRMASSCSVINALLLSTHTRHISEAVSLYTKIITLLPHHQPDTPTTRPHISLQILYFIPPAVNTSQLYVKVYNVKDLYKIYNLFLQISSLVDIENRFFQIVFLLL